MLDKIKNGLKKIGEFFTGLFNLVTYTEQQKATNDALMNIAHEMSKIHEGLDNNTKATNALQDKLHVLDQDISKIKDGLQIELFESLQSLHARLKAKGYAELDDKREAELYFTQIHNLGKDGWSEKYYNEILKLPESRDEYWSTRKK